MRVRLRVGVGAVVATFAVAACEPAPDVPPETRVTVDTVDGVEHVISGSRGAWSAAERWTVDTDAAVTIGALDGAEEYTFGKVAGLVVAGDGRIYVGDTQALEVRVYSPGGEFLFRFGRDGEGPGEFRNISGLARAPEGVAVMDGTLSRVTVSTGDGEFVRSFRLQRPYMILRHGAVMRFDERGRFYDSAPLDAAPLRDSLAAFVYSDVGEVMDTVFVAAVEEDALVIERNGLPYMSFSRPFTARPSLAIGPNGRIYFTRGDEHRILVLSPRGDTVRVVRRRVTPSPVTDAERDSAIAGVQERFRQAGAQPPSDMALPEQRPAINRLIVDTRGYLWVLGPPVPALDGTEWSIYDREGRYVGSVSMPRMDVMQIGDDFVAGVTTDELGVQRVVVASLGS